MTPFRQRRTLLQKAGEHLLDPRARIHPPELKLFLDDAIQEANDCLKVPMPPEAVEQLKKELKSCLREFTGSLLTSGTVGNALRTTSLTDAYIEEYELAYHTSLGLIKTYTANGFNFLSAVEYAIANLKASTLTKRQLGSLAHHKRDK